MSSIDSSLKRANILILEDLIFYQEAITALLKKHQFSGQLSYATQLKDAQLILESKSIQLLITDLHLPDGLSIELVKKLDLVKQSVLYQFC